MLPVSILLYCSRVKLKIFVSCSLHQQEEVKKIYQSKIEPYFKFFDEFVFSTKSGPRNKTFDILKSMISGSDFCICDFPKDSLLLPNVKRYFMNSYGLKVLPLSK